MQYIQHRVNTLRGLRNVPRVHGAEIDVRYHGDDLVLEHDPFRHHETSPETLESWLSGWSHDGPLILNVKTEGVERQCIALMRRFGVRNWFFLDLSPPYLVRYGMMAQRGEIEGFTPGNLAVRFSEHEPLASALALAGRAGWVWVDCFSRLPLDQRAADALREAGFRLCLVSPELQQHPVERIAEFRALLRHIEVDAVCTKRPDLWQSHVQAA